MSAICPTCGAAVLEGTGGCAACGATAIEALPQGETGPVPVAYDRVTPRWFGVAPVALLLGLAAVAFGGAVALFATGHWPVALILLGLSLFLLAGFGEAAKRKPDSAFAKRAFEALRSAREWAGVGVESAARRTRAQREAMQLRREGVALRLQRSLKVIDLGEAALREDEPAVAVLRDEIRGLERLAAGKEAELEETLERARARNAAARLSVQSTQLLEPPELPHAPEQYPPDEPEQYPPPDEGDPPDPPRIPEQYPPPELTPPGTAERAAG